MAKDSSAKKEKAKGFVGGCALYQQRAAQALPLLVRQAKVHQPVFYKALADEMGMPFALNLNKVLGAIGYELINLSKKWQIKIPPIQCLVVNRRQFLGRSTSRRNWGRSMKIDSYDKLELVIELVKPESSERDQNRVEPSCHRDDSSA